MSTAQKMQQLEIEALEACEFRGHTMIKTAVEAGRVTYECSSCGAYVQCTASPAPNDIEIGGPAVAVGCDLQGG